MKYFKTNFRQNFEKKIYYNGLHKDRTYSILLTAFIILQFLLFFHFQFLKIDFLKSHSFITWYNSIEVVLNGTIKLHTAVTRWKVLWFENRIKHYKLKWWGWLKWDFLILSEFEKKNTNMCFFFLNRDGKSPLVSRVKIIKCLTT